MDTPSHPRIKVIGVGNAWRGDDAAGLLVARRLKADHLPQVQISECLGTMSAIQEAWQDAAGVIVVDAVISGGLPGTIHRFDALGAELPVQGFRGASSHGWGVAEALALGRLFRELPPLLIIYGIEGKSFDHGTDMSPEVAGAIPEAARRIKGEIRAWFEREEPEEPCVGSGSKVR